MGKSYPRIRRCGWVGQLASAAYCSDLEDPLLRVPYQTPRAEGHETSCVRGKVQRGPKALVSEVMPRTESDPLTMLDYRTSLGWTASSHWIHTCRWCSVLTNTTIIFPHDLWSKTKQLPSMTGHERLRYIQRCPPRSQSGVIQDLMIPELQVLSNRPIYSSFVRSVPFSGPCSAIRARQGGSGNPTACS